MAPNPPSEYENLRTHLLQGAGMGSRYLGDGEMDIMQGLEWVRCGIADRLVSATDAAEYNHARQKHADDPTQPEPEAPHSAMFSFVARISPRNFYFSPCGNWKGPNQYADELSKVKLAALGECPDPTVFAKDWTNVIRNVRTLVSSKRTEGIRNIKGVCDERNGELATLRIRHALFEAMDPENPDPADGDLPFEFTIAGWPATHDSEECKKQLEQMVKKRTHTVVPLPAYNREGELIPPREYAEQLKDALVVVHFTFSHWTIGRTDDKDASDSYACDIVNIRVLAPPRPAIPATPKTPVKRYMMRDPFASPSPPSKRSRSGRA